VWLHVTGKIHQTLPLYYGLETPGCICTADELQHCEEDRDVTVESQVQNGSGDRATVGLSVVVVDHDGRCAQFDGDTGGHGGRREERC
jgi:beta-galactosidase